MTTKQGLQAEVVRIVGHGGDDVEAYLARPVGPGPYGGVVILHHMPGWDFSSLEIARTFAAHGYIAVEPHLFHRHGGTPEEAAAASREAGGKADEEVVGDIQGAVQHLGRYPSWNGKVAVIGYCSGGRQAWVAAAKLDLDATVSIYGRRIVAEEGDISPLRPESPLALTKDITGALLGIFGVDDENPSPEHRKLMEEELQAHGKAYEFESYEDAGHAFFDPRRDAYSPRAAREGWARILDFLAVHVGTGEVA